MFVPVLKMLKAWNKCHSDLLHSFHLETLALNVFDSSTIEDYPSALVRFFERAPARVSTVVFDPAGFNGDVGSYLKSSTDVVLRMQRAHTQATDAIDLARKQKIEEAYSRWRIIFGDYFPNYS
jgi:hypothetical protein